VAIDVGERPAGEAAGGERAVFVERLAARTAMNAAPVW
jgi:hypothetical protein